MNNNPLPSLHPVQRTFLVTAQKHNWKCNPATRRLEDCYSFLDQESMCWVSGFLQRL
uniref:Uncharacterized protein n=1 Tax=Panthera leo TaxID=9689 RepID=A0A8C8W9U4_PANLE